MVLCPYRPTDHYARPVGRLQSLRLFFGSLRPRGGESTPEVIDKDADGFRSHEPGRQKYHRGRQPHARPTLWLRPRPRIRCVSFAGDDPNSLPNEVMIKNWTKAWRSFRWETGCRPPRGHVGNVLRVTLLARTRWSTRVAPAAAAEAGTTGARIGGAIGELGCEMARCAIHLQEDGGLDRSEEPAG